MFTYIQLKGKNVDKDKLYRPVEAAKLLGISKSTLLRWEKESLIKPAKRNYRNHRVYTKEDIERIRNEMELDVLKDPGKSKE